MTVGAFAMSHVVMPLPTSTASASHASSSVDYACTVTLFIEVTCGAGHARVTRQSGRLTRFKMPRAMNESSSLKTSKVGMAMCVRHTLASCARPRLRDTSQAPTTIESRI